MKLKLKLKLKFIRDGLWYHQIEWSLLKEMSYELISGMMEDSRASRLMDYGLISRMLVDSHEWGQLTGLLWYGTTDVVVGGRGYLLNDYGEVTSIPHYTEYNEMWNSANIVNPLGVHWKDIDVGSDRTIKYIAKVLDVMEEQIAIWVVDQRNVGCSAFNTFKKFTESLLILFSSLHKIG